MSYDRVRLKMGGEGISSFTRTPGSRETSAADYLGPSFDVHVEYDHRIDRRPTARAVLVRASMPLLPATVEALVDRFGAPDAGADELSEGLHGGVAVWVDEPCGVVLTAYRPPASWWTAEGGTTLQLETLELAKKGDSPASSELSAILERKYASPAPMSMPMPMDRPEPPVVPLPTTEHETEEGPSMAADPPVVSVVAPSPPQPELRPVTSISPAPPAAPQTIATWRVQVPAGTAGSSVPNGTALQPLRTLRGVATPPDTPAERITFVPPAYPPTARWLGKTGHVTLAVVVKADGTVATSPRVVAERPPGRGFAQSAIDAVQKWRFRPAIHGGKPVESKLTIGVDFE